MSQAFHRLLQDHRRSPMKSQNLLIQQQKSQQQQRQQQLRLR